MRVVNPKNLVWNFFIAESLHAENGFFRAVECRSQEQRFWCIFRPASSLFRSTMERELIQGCR